ncbi:MAG: endonuclease/exonuclease/phosphatase family protein [Anaerolineales bacterium]
MLRIYAFFLIVILVADLALTEANPFVGLVRSFFSLLLLPALMLLPLALWLKRWILTALFLPAFIGFFVYFGSFLLPRAREAPAGEQTIRVMTFNVQYPQEKLDSLGKIIDEADPDILAVQELSPEAASYFREQFSQEYPHQALHPRQQDHAGQGLLSRFPIREDRYIRFEELPAKLGHQYTELSIDGQRLTVINTHPMPPYTPEIGFNARPHTREINWVIEDSLQMQGPTILVGDFNMSDQFEEYDRLTQEYRDAYRQVGEIELGFTYPNGRRFPLPRMIRLDYFFYNESIYPYWARTIDESGSSDHLPLLVEFSIVNDAAVDNPPSGILLPQGAHRSTAIYERQVR